MENKFASWLYNVVDKYKSFSKEEIHADMQQKAFPISILMSQIAGDFNFGTVIRSANGFNVKEVFYYGKKHYDRRGTCGTHHYIDVKYLTSIEKLKELKKEYRFVGLENGVNAQNMVQYTWQPNTLLILGEESCGISQEVLELCDDLVEIPMFGSVRSFNAAVAASLAMYDFVSKTTKNK
jgi:tRNA G18 (ribose-2'-O)-methylase SpoU